MKERNLLIVGAGSYASVVYEIAVAMNCFENIGFVDDNKAHTNENIPVIGNIDAIFELFDSFTDIIVAIGNAQVRADIIKKIICATDYNLANVISPLAYISPSAILSVGCVIEPFAVVHSGCKLGKGTIISSGAIIGHNSECSDYVHVDYNAVVASYCKVPSDTKVLSGTVFQNN